MSPKSQTCLVLPVPAITQKKYSGEHPRDSGRDGILRERCEHARGRNLADFGRICGSPHISVGSIEEMFQMINNVDNHS